MRLLVLVAAISVGSAVLSCSGTPPSSSPPVDAGHDAGVTPADAGDAGELDAGGDAGEPDAGDAGEDAGLDGGDGDAGEDAGFDAGCAGDPGDPPNRAPNPGFECGDPPEGWLPGPGSTLATELTNPHGGLQAVRIVSEDGGPSASLFPQTEPVLVPGLQTWCASAWVRGLADAGTVRVSLLAYNGTGGFTETSFSEVLSVDWQRVDVDAKTNLTHARLSMRVWIANPKPAETLIVDDVQLWSSADGGCLER
jgi:hypothetical protein